MTAKIKLIRRNAHKKIAKIFEEATTAKVYCLENDFVGDSISVEDVKRYTEGEEYAEYFDNQNGTYTIRLHSNLRYELGGVVPIEAKQLLKWLNKDWAVWKLENIFLPDKIASHITGEGYGNAKFALVFDDGTLYDLFYLYRAKLAQWAKDNGLFMEQYNGWSATFYKDIQGA